ncbi:hypothetical protein B0F90DRAFT_1622869 [Multifurca ochricompacta]|uniref:Uncharacterized protein n=1 Tax=Multifurca ochricompacta TaxID=376703 RepID=A0AAD4QS81_9AGAM|nr:hypothetical protein B0F90DRAFT_1622869 [Multifurca ochricompacta]
MSQGSTTPGPSSPSRSFLDASTAIDDLTRSLTDYSRVSTPEPPSHLPGCECPTAESNEYTKAWLAVKAKLESQLVLSAEVGQALLRRHEAYVRRTQTSVQSGKRAANSDGDPSDPEIDLATRQQLEDSIAELSREKTMLEKRFSQALLNNELTEVSNKSLTADLQELRTAFGRLSTEHARAVGWEARLRQAMQERDDFHQERDNEAQKLRAAEAKLVSLGDKCAKLHLEVRRLQEQLEEERAMRSQSSEELLHEARKRLAELHHSQVDLTPIEHHDEVMKLLESLVADKEALKKSNTELQDLLSESREALHALQEEAGERLASPPGNDQSLPSPLRFPGLRHTLRPTSPSIPMSYVTAPGPLSPVSTISSSHEKVSIGRRSLSIDWPSRRTVEPLTPETSRHSLLSGSSSSKRLRHARERNSSISIELQAGSTSDESDAEAATPEMPRSQKPLYLLQRHRAVQTDSQGCAEMLSPSQASYSDQLSLSASPNEGQSESSSLVDNPSTLGALLERAQQLFNRIAQADARTLTTRLKRQNILGADISYLSHSTVDGIVAELANLRVIFRAALEDDKFTTICTRHDLRTLLKLFKDIFKELGTVRITLNDIVLDPSIAPKVREMTLNPKDGSSFNEKGSILNYGGGWMAPLSKLFGSATSGGSKRSVSPHGANRGRGPVRSASRVAPKLGPAISASATTVNVEFTGTGAGRAITNASAPITQDTVRDMVATPVPARGTPLNLMSIFAGAPRGDPWIVLPQGSSRQPGANVDELRRATLGRAAAGRMLTAADNTQSSLPRNVDAVIDPQSSSVERGGFDPARTLRTRGLSDSSIHTTFLQHGEAVTKAPGPPEAAGTRNVLRAFGQTVFSTHSAVSGITSPEPIAPPPGSMKEPSHFHTASPRFAGLIPTISSWAATSQALDAPDPDAYAYVGSAMPNAPLGSWDRRGGGLGP